MKLEEIQELWNRDREIDYTELGTESIRIPLIHDKYLKIFTQEKIRLKSVEFEAWASRAVQGLHILFVADLVCGAVFQRLAVAQCLHCSP